MTDERPVPEGHPFALLLTHDVDRPYKKPFHAAYYALRERDPGHLRDLASGRNPYWQFDAIRALEDDLGVRSAFYFLLEPSLGERRPTDLLEFDTWVQLLTRYRLDRPRIAALVRELDAGGWEVGVHGSLGSATDADRLREEIERIESVLGRPVRGGRQHYLDLERPDTWRRHAALGLDYDASLGSSTDYGFDHGYDVYRPFDGGFVVFPLTLMDSALPDPATRFDDAVRACESLLAEAEAEGAVMTVLFHPRLFSREDFPGYRAVYRRLVEDALSRGAWVGSPGRYYDEFLAGESGADPAERAVSPPDPT